MMPLAPMVIPPPAAIRIAPPPSPPMAEPLAAVPPPPPSQPPITRVGRSSIFSPPPPPAASVPFALPALPAPPGPAKPPPPPPPEPPPPGPLWTSALPRFPSLSSQASSLRDPAAGPTRSSVPRIVTVPLAAMPNALGPSSTNVAVSESVKLSKNTTSMSSITTCGGLLT
jgi:hypothetical protein